MSVVRDEYIKALQALRGKRSDDLQLMHASCPHLTARQVAELRTGLDTKYFAMPPLRIAQSYHVGSWIVGDCSSHFEPTYLYKRTTASYVDGKPHNPTSDSHPYAEEAMAYAAEHWPDELCRDDWKDVFTLGLHDPVDLHRNMPRQKAVITVGLRCGMDVITNSSHMLPVQLLDYAIVIATLDHLEGRELKGGRGISHYNLCARCGGSLARTQCNDCGAQYDFFGGYDWAPTPLPPKLVKLMRDAGHRFQLDPARLY